MNKLQGYKNEVVGALKENFGYYLGNKNMQMEGASLKNQGAMELRYADGEFYLNRTRRTLNREIVESRKLQHPKNISDRSAPYIEKGLKIKKSVRKQIFRDSDLQNKKLYLRHVTMVDKSVPMFPPNFKTKRFSRPYLADIRERRFTLRHPKNINDRSAPFFEKQTHMPSFNLGQFRGYRDQVVGALKQNVGYLIRNKRWESDGASLRWRGEQERRLAAGDIPFSDLRHKLNREICMGRKLARPKQINDRSAPIIEKDVKIQRVEPSKPNTIQQQLLKTKKSLHHVETVDRSKPFCATKPVVFEEIPAAESKLQEEVRQGTTLKHVTEIHDSSAPKIDKNISSSKILPTNRV